jgi:YesN/AraC family two-component response regulator
VDTYRFDPRIKTAIRYITDHYAEPMHITQVARAVSLNPVYFGVLFKKETQMAFRDYLNMIRLNQAEDMLRTGEWNVTEVALRCGFGDVFYFSRLYKKHKGVPPSKILG